MIPTRGQVHTRFLNLLDDVAGDTYTDPIFQEAFAEAYDALFNAFENYKIPRINLIATTEIMPMTTEFVPSDTWPDFANFDFMEERAFGSTDRFRRLGQCDVLPQRDMLDRLLDFVWRNDTFYFVGATTAREVRVYYASSGDAPTDDGTTIRVDGCTTFLAKYSAAVAGPRKGDDELANRYWADAVGPAYEQGKIGGELWRIIMPRSREMQHVQLVPRAYSVYRRSSLFSRMPYIAAQTPQGHGMAPAQFTNADGTITGMVDGLNSLFFLAYPVAVVDDLTVNGVRMTKGLDYVHGANVINFLPRSIPSDFSAVITCSGWV